MQKWTKLQNGSDIRGVALEGIAGESVNLTAKEVKYIGHAFTLWLSKKLGQSMVKITVGHDSRLSAQALKTGVIEGIFSAQGLAIDCGLATTPSLFMSTILTDIDADGGIMITASHLPFNRNGLKFFSKDGGLDKPDITEILRLCHELENNGTVMHSTQVANTYDLVGAYSDYLVDLIRKRIDAKDNYMKPLTGFKVIVDAGNGAGGFFASRVLEPLGAETSGSQFLDPDGMFPNHMPNPEDAAAMASIMQATVNAKADLGIIFDTDVDRSAVVLSDGSEINRNKLIAMMAAIVLKDNPGTTIVTDSVTSDGLGHFIAQLGGVHRRFKRGYKNVINESVKLNHAGVNSALAIETSGHGALKENFFLDDGAYMSVKILIEMARLKTEGKTLESLVEGLEEPLESAEIRIKIIGEDFKTLGDHVLKALQTEIDSMQDWSLAPDNFEGMRVNAQNDSEQGWFLLRMSLHDPVMPLNIESNTIGGVKAIALRVHSILEKYESLDVSGFKQVL